MNKKDYSRVGETRYMISTSNLSRHISLKTSYDKDQNMLIIDELPLNMKPEGNQNQKLNIFIDGIPYLVERIDIAALSEEQKTLNDELEELFGDGGTGPRF